MRKIITSFISLSIALVGIIGGILWGINSKWEIESIILTVCSGIEIIGFLALKLIPESESARELKTFPNNQQTTVNVSVGNVSQEPNSSPKDEPPKIQERNLIIELMKSRLKTLFIDDDKNFNVVKILKNSGWKHTKAISDVKTLDSNPLKDSEIVFVDINGVGKLLALEHQGLDLALMIKQKYENKRVIIYSANKNTNAFHSAWDKCDYKLEKNALPYQFQNLVENYSVDIYKMQK